MGKELKNEQKTPVSQLITETAFIGGKWSFHFVDEWWHGMNHQFAILHQTSGRDPGVVYSRCTAASIFQQQPLICKAHWLDTETYYELSVLMLGWTNPQCKYPVTSNTKFYILSWTEIKLGDSYKFIPAKSEFRIQNYSRLTFLGAIRLFFI